MMRWLSISVLILSLLVYGCGGAQVDGDFQLLHPPSGPLDDIVLLEGTTSTLESAVMVPDPGPISNIEKGWRGFLHGALQGAVVGAGLCFMALGEDDENNYGDKDDFSDSGGGFLALLSLCGITAGVGSVAGGLVGPFVGVENTFASGTIHADPQVIRSAIVEDEVVEKIWGRLVQGKGKEFRFRELEPTPYESGKFSGSVHFVKIEPMTVGLVPFVESEDKPIRKYQLAMKFTVTFLDQEKQSWARETVSATVGKHRFARWYRKDAKLVKKSLKKGYKIIAKQICDDLRNGLVSYKDTDSERPFPLPSS